MSQNRDIVNIPGYEIVRLIGRGGMAKVYLAKKAGLEGYVALKIINLEYSDDKNFQARFQKEVQILGSLRHPNIVQYYGAGKFQNHIFMALEYIDGADLKKQIKAGPINPGLILKWFKEIGDALDYSHRKGFIHRDIKPENVLLRKDGSAVLTDFGIAKAYDGSGTQITGTGLSIGTPYYMSPEQARGRLVSARTDIYSAGVMLYEMLTGKVPFSGTDPIAIGIAHISKPIPDLPLKYVYWEPIIRRMMAKEESARYANMQEVLRDMNALASSGKLEFQGSSQEAQAIRTRLLPVQPREPEGVRKTPTPSPRVSSTQEPTVISPSMAAPAGPQPTRRERRERRGKPAAPSRAGWYVFVLVILVGLGVLTWYSLKHPLGSAWIKRFLPATQPSLPLPVKREETPPKPPGSDREPPAKSSPRRTETPRRLPDEPEVIPPERVLPPVIARPQTQSVPQPPMANSGAAASLVQEVQKSLSNTGIGFFIMAHEVSTGEYNTYARVAGARSLSGDQNEPARGMSYQEALAFSAFLSARSQLRFSLPSREEWIQAVTGNHAELDYAWGMEPNGLSLHAVCLSADCATSELQGVSEGVSPTIHNLYHVHGNVAELTRSCTPQGCYAMGGSYRDRPPELAISRPQFLSSGRGSPTVGFRLIAR